jgi:hypothetical protein
MADWLRSHVDDDTGYGAGRPGDALDQLTDPGARVGGPLQVVPALIGAFAGAPVLAREMETGTFRFAWTQGFGRWRWALAKLVSLAVLLAAAAGASGVLVSWHHRSASLLAAERRLVLLSC